MNQSYTPSYIPITVIKNELLNSSPNAVENEVIIESTTENEDSAKCKPSEALCKYCKKEIVKVRGDKPLKTCESCLEKKKQYEIRRGKELRKDRITMYKERYSIVCSTCHTRPAMRKDGKQYHTCQRCADYKRLKYTLSNSPCCTGKKKKRP